MKGFIAVTGIIALAIIFAISASAQPMPPMPPPLPPFLEGADQSVIKQFDHLIASSGSLTDSQIDAAVDEWISKQSDDIKNKYNSFKEEMKKHQAAAEAAHQASIAKFSPEAKAADQRLSAVANNPTLTSQSKSQQIYQIMKSLPENVRQEIETAMMGPMGA
uniref:SXP/RAL-2 family protein Ani s 5-like cation-binding domain-containing protein n=1 Tax=Panagrolaimus sp. PS1159 TaxID=55785 RepID=A0AC35FIU2_9BILA